MVCCEPAARYANHLGDDSWRLLNRLQQSIQEPPKFGCCQARELLEEDPDADGGVFRAQQ